MLFYDSAMPAPNPRRVRIFAAEKGITLPTQDVSILKGEHKREDFKDAHRPFAILLDQRIGGVDAKQPKEPDLYHFYKVTGNQRRIGEHQRHNV